MVKRWETGYVLGDLVLKDNQKLGSLLLSLKPFVSSVSLGIGKFFVSTILVEASAGAWRIMHSSFFCFRGGMAVHFCSLMP
jgi:hypothetical protein